MELFGTAGIRGDVGERVTPELAQAVGRAAAIHARRSRSGDEARQAADGAGADRDRPTFIVGIDGRTTGEGLAAAVAAGLASGGATVQQVGRVPTPALAFAAQGRRGIMITASHNPPGDNGIKLFRDGVEYDGEAEDAIESLVAEEPAPAAWNSWGGVEHESVLEDYRDAVAEFVRGLLPKGVEALDGDRVAVGCGNGVAGLATPHVLRRLGAAPIALNANVDGTFPARESKPTAETLTELRSVVAETDAVEVGIGHDGDGDRLVVVGPDGEVVHEDTILAVIAERYVRESDADDPVVVTTPNASGRIDERVDAAGGRTERVALGALHEGIARERAAGGEDTEIVFAAEPWKHTHPAFGGWIDAVASAAVVAALVAESGGVAELTADVTERPYRKESVECPDEAKAAAMERIGESLPKALDPRAVDTEYGVRAELEDGAWVLVRPSGTEPYIRIYAESDTVDTLIERTREVVEAPRGDD